MNDDLCPITGPHWHAGLEWNGGYHTGRTAAMSLPDERQAGLRGDPTKLFYEAVFAWRESGSEDGLGLLAELAKRGLDVRLAAQLPAQSEHERSSSSGVVPAQEDRLRLLEAVAERAEQVWEVLRHDDSGGHPVYDLGRALAEYRALAPAPQDGEPTA